MISEDLNMIVDIYNTDKKYQIIYADPPWYESGGGRIKRGANRHYKLMTTREIMNLPVSRVADDNCHLYLWTTNNFLEDAIKVVNAWGFKYKTMITWVKDRFGLGQYFRGQTEHCIFAVKGFIPYKIDSGTGKRCQGTTCFYAKRRNHSEKPEEMRKLIELVSDRSGFNKIELFARKQVNGWDVWGDEVNEEG